MRKVLFLAAVLVFGTASFATANVELPVLKADKVFVPIGNTGKKISLAELSKISVKDMQELKGKKMNFFERLNFKLAQSKLRKAIAEDGTIKSKKLQKMLAKGGDGTTGFHLGGFALGFFVGLIGVLIAYLINDDKKSNRVKWAWLGLAAIVVLDIIIIVALL